MHKSGIVACFTFCYHSKCDHFLTTAHNNNRNYSHFNGWLDVVLSTDLNHMNYMTLVFSQHAAITSQKPSLERTKNFQPSTQLLSSPQHHTGPPASKFPTFSCIAAANLGVRPWCKTRPEAYLCKWAKAAKAVSTSAASSS